MTPPPVVQPVQASVWAFVPFLVILFGMVLFLLPLPWMTGQPVKPFIIFIGVFYWTLYRTNLMPLWSVFLLGLAQDSFYHYPLGLSSLLLLFWQMMLLRYPATMSYRSFFASWIRFGFSSILLFTIYWAVYSLMDVQLYRWRPVAISWVLTWLLYPLMHMLFDRLEDTLPDIKVKS